MEENFRTFINWSVEEVLEWMKRLPLSRDYSTRFHGAKMDGSKLLKINQGTLDQLKVLDQGDRVTILQEVTAMRAALMTNSRSLSRQEYSHTQRHTPSPDVSGRYSPGPPLRPLSTSPNLKERPGILRRGRAVGDRRASSPQQRFSDVSAGYTDYRQHSPLLRQRKSEGQVKGLTRGSGWPLVDVLKEENTSLKKDLDYYHKKTRKLQKLEQEIEAIREAHQLLEVSTQRRETLEKAMRKKLEEDVKQQKERNLKLQVELQLKSTSVSRKKKTDSSKMELERRDSVIVQLLRKQRESLEARERLEEDLLQTKAQLNQKMSESTLEEEELGSTSSAPRDTPTPDEHFTASSNTGEAMKLYLGSIERLRGALKSMQQMNNSREQLEISLRQQLESEVEILQNILYTSNGKRNGFKSDTESHVMREKDMRIASLMADIAKLEQKYLEMSTENQMTLDSATLPRDAMISHLERVVRDQGDTIAELKQQKMNYIEKLYNVNKRVADLESRLQTMQSTITEKDALIQTLQEAFAYNGESTFSVPFGNETGNVKPLLTRATSSDDILLSTPPPSPGRRRRFQTDLPEDIRHAVFELHSPHRVGSLMRAASSEHILSETKPRSIPVKGNGGSSWEGGRMRRSLSNDVFLNEEQTATPNTHPLARKRGTSIPEDKGKSPERYIGRLSKSDRVKSCETGLDEKGVSMPLVRARPQSMVEGVVRVLSNEKKRLSTHFLDTLAKATSIDSLSSCNSSDCNSPLLPSTPRVVHRFSAISPNSRKKSPENEKSSSLPSCFRSASMELLDGDRHHYTANHDQSLSDGEVEEGGKVSLTMQPPLVTPTALFDGCGNSGSNTPLSSLVTQRLTVKTDSLTKLPLTAWTSTPESPKKTNAQNKPTTDQQLQQQQPCLV